MALFDLNQVGLSNESYSAEEEGLIGGALIVAKQDPTKRNEETARYEIALAPHDKLAEDVLRHIFTVACLNCDPRPLHEHPLMVLSRVCSGWRRVMFNMPRLWANVSLKASFYPKCDITPDSSDYRRIRFVQFWQDRGGSLPKQLTIEYRSTHRQLNGVVQHLVAPYHFDYLYLQLERHELEAVRDIPTEHMVHLSQLQMRCPTFENPIAIHLPLPTQMPKLQFLHLCSCFEENLEKLISAVPWHNMRRLDLQFRIPSTTCFNVILRRGVLLERCSLKPASDSAFSSTPIEEPVTLPVLENLILHCESITDVDIFRSRVLTPAAYVRQIDIRIYGDVLLHSIRIPRTQ